MLCMSTLLTAHLGPEAMMRDSAVRVPCPTYPALHLPYPVPCLSTPCPARAYLGPEAMVTMGTASSYDPYPAPYPATRIPAMGGKSEGATALQGIVQIALFSGWAWRLEKFTGISGLEPIASSAIRSIGAKSPRLAHTGGASRTTRTLDEHHSLSNTTKLQAPGLSAPLERLYGL